MTVSVVYKSRWRDVLVKQLKELLRKWLQDKLKREEASRASTACAGREARREARRGGRVGRRLLSAKLSGQQVCQSQILYLNALPMQLTSLLESAGNQSDIRKSGDGPRLCIPHITTMSPTGHEKLPTCRLIS